MFFLDESGFGLSLPPTYAWARQGEAVRVPRAWGKSGRVNAVAHLERRSCGGWALGYALLEGRCGTGEVVAYLEGLSREGVRGVVFLDHAPFHRSRGFREAVERWRGRGLEVAYLPRYSPHLNPVESVWRRVKGFLMPRRHYGSVEELRGAVAVAMERLREGLGQGVLQSLCIGTYNPPDLPVRLPHAARFWRLNAAQSSKCGIVCKCRKSSPHGEDTGPAHPKLRRGRGGGHLWTPSFYVGSAGNLSALHRVPAQASGGR